MDLLEAGSSATSITTFAAKSEGRQETGQRCAVGSGRVVSVQLG